LPGVDGIQALRGVLKKLLRSYGLRCTNIRETPDAKKEQHEEAPAQ
jgi:hypothetical protein